MAANAGVADLVAEINAALLAADPTGSVAATLAPGTGQIGFAATAKAPAGSSLVVDHFVTVQYAGFADLVNFKNLGVGDVAAAIAQAVAALGQYSSLGFLNEKLPLIGRSVVDLVDYGAQFAAAFQQFEANPNASIQQFGDALAKALGLPPGALALSYDAPNKALKLLMTYSPLGYDQYIPLVLDLGQLADEASNPAARTALQGLASIVDVTGKSRLHVQAGVTLTLDLGFSMAGGAATAFLYNDTGVKLTALLAANAVSFDASLGPLTLSIQGGSAAFSADGASTTAPASFTLGIAPGAGNPTLSDFARNLKQDTAIDLRAGLGLDLPISLVGASLGDLRASVPDVRDLFNKVANSVTITTPDLKGALKNLGSLSNLLRNPQAFLGPLNAVFSGLRSTLDGQLLSANLPLIGSRLKDGSAFLATIQDEILAPLSAAIKAAGDPVQAVANALQSALRHIDPAATVTVYSPPDGSAVQFDIHLAGDLNYATPFDLGLSALGLGLSGSVNVDFAWALNLDVGLSSSRGFYVVAHPTTNPADPTSAPLDMVSVRLSATLPGASFRGSLAFLDLSATNNPGGDPTVTDPGGTDAAQATGLYGSLVVNLAPAGGGPDAPVPLSGLSGGSLKALLDVRLDASAWVNLHLVTSVGGNAMFPSFATDFVMNWAIGHYQFGKGGSIGDSPKVAFENVALDLGGFISSFVAPILNVVRPIFDAINPVVTVLTQRIPVISDLAGSDVSLATLAETFDPGHAEAIRSFLADWQMVYRLINSVSGAGGSGLTIDFGTFDLGGLLGDLRGAKSLKAAKFDKSKLPSMPDADTQLSKKGNASAATKSFTHGITHTSGSLAFPILQDPSSVLQLLMGQTINLVTYSSPTLTASFNYTQVFPIFGPLVATLGGEVSASLHVAFGYDTFGVQEWAHAGFAPSELPKDLSDGFYLVADGTPNVALHAGITAGAGINLGLASGGVDGGIFADVNMALHDPDGTGKLRLQTIIHELSNPADIFDISGRVYAQLQAYLTVGVGPFSFTKNFDITPQITLVSFAYVPSHPPTLASQGNDGSLTLNTGPHSADRATGNTNEGDQTFTVRHAGGAGGSETVTVTAYGTTTTYTNITKLVAQGGLGDDTIDLTGVQSDAQLTGGQGHNTLIGGSGRNTLLENQFTSYTLTGGRLTGDGADSSGNSWAGVDTFSNIQNIVLAGPAAGHATFDLHGYVGDSTLQGHGGDNTFKIDLSPDGLTTITGDGPGQADAIAVTLADGTDTTLSPGRVVQGVNTIDYGGDASLKTLTVDGTLLPTRYTIFDTPAGPIRTTLNTGDGNDIVDVRKTSGPTTINAGAGIDTVNVGALDAGPGGVLSGIGGTLTVATVIGDVTLNADDTGNAAAASGTLTASALTGFGMGAGGIAYNNLMNLNLKLGSGGATLAIRSTQQYATTTVVAPTAGSAASTYTVGSAAPGTTGGNVQGIAGAVLIQGSGRDTLNLDDSGDAAPRSLLVTATTLTQLGMPAARGITYSGLAWLNVNLGTGGDVASVASTAGATTTTIRGAANSAANTIDVGSLAPTAPGGVVRGIAGPLVVHGSGADILNIDDTGDATAQTSTLTDHALTGLGMGPSGISFDGLGVFKLDLGTGGNSILVNITNDLPALSTVNAGTPADIATLTYQHNLDGVLNLVGFANAPTASVAGDLTGNLDLTRFAVVPLLTIGGSVAPTAVITGVNINRMTVGGSLFGELDLTGNLGQLDVARDMTGLVNVAGTLTRAVIGGGTPGAFVARRVGTIATAAGFGEVALQVREDGIQRRVEAASPANPYPLASALHATTFGPTPGNVTFRSMYEGLVADTGSGSPPANPQITLRVIQGNRAVAAQGYDLSFVTWDDSAKFNLARLDALNTAGGPNASGLRDVAIEGDLLASVSPEARAFFGQAGLVPGGVRLALDPLAGVAVRDYAPRGGIQAASLQSVAFGSFSQNNGTVLDGGQANFSNAGALLATTTWYAQAATGTTFRVPFSDRHNVALFVDTLANRTVFDLQPIVFTDQHRLIPGPASARNGVAALVTTGLSLVGGQPGSTYRALIAGVALDGDSGSFSTGQWVNGPISSTGALGDVTLSDAHGLTGSLTAPGIFGSIKALSGPIAGTIQTTGARVDPITRAVSAVSADLGRTYAGPNGTTMATQVLAGAGGLTGQVLAGGNLLGQVIVRGPISGLVAARGNIGATVAGPGGTTVRLGGITTDGLLSGQVEATGDLVGDVALQGGMANGQVAVAGSILGDLKVIGPMGARSTIVAGGSIGDPTAGTSLSFAPSVTAPAGLVVAKGAVRLAPTGPRPAILFHDLPPGPNASAVDALFAQLGQDLANGTPARAAKDPARLKVAAGTLIYNPT